MKYNFENYLMSKSTRYGWIAGLVMFSSYAACYHLWNSIPLIAICLFIGGFIPFYSRFSNAIEEKIQFKTAMISPGRWVRFLFQLAFNLAIFGALLGFKLIPSRNTDSLGGIFGVALLTTLASQGIQYVMISLANREKGEKNRNVLLGLSFNIAMTALATMGFPLARQLFLFSGLVFGAVFIGMGFLSDGRARFPKKGGIGIFFGTFNPFHRTHLKIIEDAIRERNLSKVYLHSTVVPKLHSDSLKRSEIRIAKREAGMRVYEKTARADFHVNYFPTGNRFYEFETRKLFMKLAIQDAGLFNQVEVLSLPEVYEKTGFYGIVDAIQRKHPGETLHGIHGSDLGGMWIRNIYDESGWIYPYPVKRVDGVSATRIREGAQGMAAPLVDQLILRMRQDETDFELSGLKFKLEEGVLAHENV